MTLFVIPSLYYQLVLKKKSRTEINESNTIKKAVTTNEVVELEEKK
jgi:hypothetical protein